MWGRAEIVALYVGRFLSKAVVGKETGPGMKCPYCEHEKTRVIDTSHDTRGGIRRRRLCVNCNHRFSTYERAVLATPMLVKRDGTREEFSREKLRGGIRVACAALCGTRAGCLVAAVDIEQMIGEIEAELQQMGKSEVPSRLVGDKVIKRLKELDEVAYIRYAIVYLRLDDLESVRTEIDHLLQD